MVTFNSSKGSDDVVAGSVRVTSFPNSGYPNFTPFAPTFSNYPTPRILGKKRESYFNRTKNYRPGQGVINPVVHYENSAECSDDDTLLYMVYELPNRVMRPTKVRRLEGPLAALAQQGFSSSFPVGRMPDERELDTLVRAVSKSRDTAASLMVTIGELPETLAMLRSPFQMLARQGEKIRKASAGPFRGFNSRVTNAWLLLQYGIMPLLNDVDTIRTAINSKLGKDFGLLLKSRASSTLAPTVTSGAFVRNAGPCYLHGSEEYRTFTKVRALNLYRSNVSVVGDLGLGISSLIPTLLELVPYSFVLEWFIDVGNWLKTALPNTSVKDGFNCLSMSVESHYKLSLRHASLTQVPSAYYPASPASGIYTQKRVAYHRNVNFSLPALPQLNRRALNLSQQVSGAALALQRAFNAFPRLR